MELTKIEGYTEYLLTQLWSEFDVDLGSLEFYDYPVGTIPLENISTGCSLWWDQRVEYLLVQGVSLHRNLQFKDKLSVIRYVEDIQTNKTIERLSYPTGGYNDK